MKLKLYATVTSKNYLLIHDVIDDAIKYGTMSVRFTNYIKQGNALHLEDSNVLTDEQIDWFLNEVNKERSLYEQNFMDIERCGSFEPSDSKKFNCYAIKNNVVLIQDNNLYPCIFLAKHGYEIGYFDGNKLLINDICYNKNDGKEYITKEYCNHNNVKKLQRKVGVKL